MTDRKRESARLRKQRQVERNREKRRLEALAEAERIESQERTDEHLSPAIMRNPIIAHDGTMITGPRVHIVNGIPTRAMALRLPGRPEDLRLSSTEHRAAKRLADDWRDVGSGLGVGATNWLQSSRSSSTGTPPGYTAMLAQIETRKDLDEAIIALGAFAPALARVILDCIPLGIYAIEANLTLDNARAWIGAGLARLAKHYWPEPIQRTPQTIQTYGPARETYSMEPIDAA